MTASRIWRFLTLVLVPLAVLAVDQLTKAWAASILGPEPGERHLELVDGWLRLTYVTNTGAAFGILPDKTVLFTMVALAAVPFLFLLHRQFSAYGRLGQASIGLLLGGTLGNLLDRLRLGYVVDFIDAGVGSLRWPTFNLADSTFVLGVAVAGLFLLLVPAGGRRHGAT